MLVFTSDIGYRHVIETGIKQLLDARVNWQWGPYSNAEAILGITLSKDDWYQEEDADSYVTVQAMEIELLAALSRLKINVPNNGLRFCTIHYIMFGD